MRTLSMTTPYDAMYDTCYITTHFLSKNWKRIALIWLLLWGVFCGSSWAQENTFYKDHARGWHWYERMPVIEEKPNEEKKEPAQPSVSSEERTLQTYRKRLEAYQKRVEGLKARAVLDPTPSHVQAYIQEQQRVIRRGEDFGKMWQWVVFQNPELDADVTDPKSQKMRHVVYEEERKTKDARLKALSKTHGLMFFFSTQCAFCHEIAPVVQLFAKTYGWDVLAVSMDGGTLPGFDRIVNDNGTASSLGVTHFPTVLAVNPNTREVLPLAYGAQGMEEMTERAMVLTRGQPSVEGLGEPPTGSIQSVEPHQTLPLDGDVR